MKFDLSTNYLFTDDFWLIKQLACRFQEGWDKLSPTDDLSVRLCSICQHGIRDTARLTYTQILDIMERDPLTCLKLDFSQDNLTLL